MPGATFIHATTDLGGRVFVCYRHGLRTFWLVLLVAACDEGGDVSTSPVASGSSGGSAKGGGFSADLAKSLGGGSGSAEAGSAAVQVVPAPPPVATPGAPRIFVKPSPELAAIKLSLEPNWERDIGEAGTISLVVRVPNKDEGRVFSFQYGYEDPKAPLDREAYKQWLADSKILTPKLDRQRGAAWYLEGPDSAGRPWFRVVVNYGGKKLICGGALYKDAASNQLGDLRDKTLIQAKSICESLSL